MYTAHILVDEKWQALERLFEFPGEICTLLIFGHEDSLGKVTNEDGKVVWLDPEARKYL